MVHYQRYHPLKKGGVDVFAEGDEESQSIVGLIWGNTGYNKRTRPRLLSLLFLSLISCSLILAPQFFSCPSSFSLLYSFGHGDESLIADLDVNKPLCSSISNGTICCDRSSIRSDICIMKGDVRTHSLSSSVFLYSSTHPNDLIDYASVVAEDDKEEELQHEKVRPYTRKWEAGTMATIDELNLISKRETSRPQHACDVRHDVPAVFFSTGGYTGNIYHEFNDGILPLYITSQHLNKRVVFVILEYHDWWFMKYGDVLSHLSDYPPIDFSNDNRTHCFPEAIVGMRIHDELTVDPSLMEGGKTIRDFRTLLDRAYWPRISSLIEGEEREKAQLNSQENPSSQPSSHTSEEVREHWELKKPKLTILSRNGSRAITNEDFLVQMAEKIGFEVEVLRPSKTSELAQIYRSLNSSDVMVGVHGAAMTHFLFLRPGSVFIQVVPLGTEWAAETYYGDPAKKLGLKYISYKILPRESSLYDEYDKSDPVLTDPSSVSDKGWEFTKKIYLDRQNVRLNLARFRKRLVRAYDYSFAKKNQRNHLMSQ
ncbi:EGF domain-specific O-linked N-acetylglucosamine transferase [Actinidia chinensis var. chinensis]|uniref:EGF domain-specific O-linked N-acetylglucosamine transferase n=1 Tax=Actinidia chinensis var. chinensis TaxID=1590841 RepID=A0A2R6R5A6_ACTCC|nr:EGF domain-specific O-linked N-acetylglucosamine transferase [Actinidia chinensis var. chinensis]